MSRAGEGGLAVESKLRNRLFVILTYGDGYSLEAVMNKCVVVAAVLWCVAGSAPWAVADDRGRNLSAIANTGGAGCTLQAPFPTREQALAEIEKVGGEVEIEANKPGRPVRKISLRGDRVTDRELALLILQRRKPKCLQGNTL